MSAAALKVNTVFPTAFEFLFWPGRYRFRVAYGGRGSGKTTNFARALVSIAYTKKVRILCTRQLQRSIADSVHKILSDSIGAMGLSTYFTIQAQSIVCTETGSEFIFKGLQHQIAEIKGLENIMYCWVEEAQAVTQEAWDILIPTIRAAGSEIWVTYNPHLMKDATHQMFVVNPSPRALVRKVNYDQNPYFTQTEFEEERAECEHTDPDKYRWVWFGECKTISDAVIFKNKYTVEEFIAPERARHFFGLDFGHGLDGDPCALVRCHIRDRKLYCDWEAGGTGLELDALPVVMDTVPDVRKWIVRCDSSRPESISFLKRRGFRTISCDKWQGSIDDGIAFIKSFEQIVVHPRCKRLIDELGRYSWKVDKVSNEILPVPVDKHNHFIDSLRYSLSSHMRGGRTSAEVWKILAS